MRYLIQLMLRGKTIWARAALLCIVAAVLPATAAEVAQTIYYNGASLPTDKRAGYYLKLLDLVLSKTGNRYALRPKDTPMPHQRAMRNMGSNEGIDVFWGPTTREMERLYLPIRIPIDKGILGWRIFLINARDRQLFEDVHSLKQLQSYSAGQVYDWADTEILRANGLKVVGAQAYEQMFDMLAADRFQYFPRGIGEVWNEAKSQATLGLEVEQHLVLHYPAYTYFFVSRSNTILAQWIEQGLRAAIADGSFDKLFESFNAESIKRAHLNTRTVFELANPLLPDEAPSMRPSDLINR